MVSESFPDEADRQAVQTESAILCRHVHCPESNLAQLIVNVPGEFTFLVKFSYLGVQLSRQHLMNQIHQSLLVVVHEIVSILQRNSFFHLRFVHLTCKSA